MLYNFFHFLNFHSKIQCDTFDLKILFLYLPVSLLTDTWFPSGSNSSDPWFEYSLERRDLGQRFTTAQSPFRIVIIQKATKTIVPLCTMASLERLRCKQRKNCTFILIETLRNSHNPTPLLTARIYAKAFLKIH